MSHNIRQPIFPFPLFTVEEQLSGWYTQIRKARNATEQEAAYRRLQDAVEFFGRVSILPFTLVAINRWEQLRRSKLNVSSMDLKIAAVALEHQAILVSRNSRDFQRVPSLTSEDWSAN